MKLKINKITPQEVKQQDYIFHFFHSESYLAVTLRQWRIVSLPNPSEIKRGRSLFTSAVTFPQRLLWTLRVIIVKCGVNLPETRFKPWCAKLHSLRNLIGYRLLSGRVPEKRWIRNRFMRPTWKTNQVQKLRKHDFSTKSYPATVALPRFSAKPTFYRRLTPLDEQNSGSIQFLL